VGCRSVTADKEVPVCMDSDGDLVERLYKIDNTNSVVGLSDGLQAAYVFAPDAWKEAASAAAHHLAEAGGEFSIDDIRRLGIEEWDKPQRWGSLLAVMKNAGAIERVGLQEHRTPKGDGNLVRRWRGAAGTVKEAAA
jgi:hypothetical protein